jgi:beta-N-acetylhexosaminidase
MKKLNQWLLAFALWGGVSVPAFAQTTPNPNIFKKVNKLYGFRDTNHAIVKHPNALKQIDDFIEDCIAKRAFPGCQVFAAKDGQVVMMKSYGTMSYKDTFSVTDTTMYDVASVTKIISTTLALMKLYDEGKLKLKETLGTYFSWVKGTDKENITIEQLLLHQAGFKGWIPFHKQTLDSLTGTLREDLFANRKVEEFTIPVCANMYLSKSFPIYMLSEMIKSPLVNKGKYVYSDIDLILLQKVVESITKQRLDAYVYDNFYEPLRLLRTMYNPWLLGLQKSCAPTEFDNEFRMQLVQGYVHDPVASLMGGMAGHAGVFSTAREVGQIMQMLLNGGVYNGKRFFSKETVALFTSYRSNISRRGYGFDKPEKKKGEGGPTADVCSKYTFGHTGFTGTCTWADPETGIVFVFLSNRVHPSQDNGLITSLKVRGKIQTYIYEALGYANK